MADLETLAATTRYWTEVAAPGTPAAGKAVTYVKSDGKIYLKDDAGTETDLTAGGGGAVATDAIWDAAGDLAVGTGANTAAKLAIGASGTVPKSNGTTLAYALPPGHEFDYVQDTAGGTISATSEATATTLITGSAIAYDGSTIVMIEAFIPEMDTGTADAICIVDLYDGASSIGFWALLGAPDAGSNRTPIRLSRRLTPSAATHTYSLRAHRSVADWTWTAGAGGAGVRVPAFIRITKAN